MTKRYTLTLATLAVALLAALAFGGFIPALAQDGEDDPETPFPCPMWGDFENVPEDWAERFPDGMPHGRGMMWYYYNGEDLPEGWDEMPRGFGPGMMWGVNPEELPEEWAEWYANMPDTLPEGWDEMPRGFGPGMMWYHYNGEELPEGYEDMPFGPGMMWGLDGEDLPEDWAEWMEDCPMCHSR